MFDPQKTVVTTKSVEFMPFMLSFFFFLNGGIWAFYALLVRDIFLGLSAFSFLFFLIFIEIIILHNHITYIIM